MKTVIMAGGKGTRISSVASDIPKPMIKIEGKPVLEHELECLRDQGFTDIILTVSHLGNIIMDYFGDGSGISPVTGKPFGVHIEFYFEKEPLGNAGALFKIKDKLTSDFLLLNADAVFDVDFNRFVAFHREHGGLVTLFTHPNSHPYDSGLIIADIQDETKGCDILYRLDERLSMPEQDYFDYASDSFARFYGPRFNFDGTNLDTKKTIIVHIDESTQAKLLMVIKKCIDQNTNTDFWHIEIETLPYYEKRTYPVITTFLHGMYYPINKIFTHIDYTKNQYSAGEYSQKYADSVDGMSIDHYTSCRDLHYKIWCIENGQFSRETWYKLMMVSLPKIYQNLLNEILN